MSILARFAVQLTKWLVSRLERIESTPPSQWSVADAEWHQYFYGVACMLNVGAELGIDPRVLGPSEASFGGNASQECLLV